MAGPIVRSGRVILGVELAVPKLNALPVTGALAATQKAAAAAAGKMADASARAADALRSQAAAEDAANAAATTSKSNMAAIIQEQRTQLRLKQSLAAAVQAEKESVAAAVPVHQSSAAVISAGYRKAMEAVNNVGEGFFRVTRAAVLFGATSEESFQRMLRSLATVQAGFDLFKGSMQILRGVTDAINLMKAAQLSSAAASAASSTALAANAGALASMTAALGPVGAAVAVVSAAVGAGAVAWSFFADSQSRANAEIAANVEWARRQSAAWANAERQLEASKANLKLQREMNMTPAERVSSIDKELAAIREMHSVAKEMAKIWSVDKMGPPATAAHATFEAEMIDAEARRLELERERRHQMEMLHRGSGDAIPAAAGGRRESEVSAEELFGKLFLENRMQALRHSAGSDGAALAEFQDARNLVEREGAELATAVVNLFRNTRSQLAMLENDNRLQRLAAATART